MKARASKEFDKNLEIQIEGEINKACRHGIKYFWRVTEDEFNPKVLAYLAKWLEFFMFEKFANITNEYQKQFWIKIEKN